MRLKLLGIILLIGLVTCSPVPEDDEGKDDMEQEKNNSLLTRIVTRIINIFNKIKKFPIIRRIVALFENQEENLKSRGLIKNIFGKLNSSLHKLENLLKNIVKSIKKESTEEKDMEETTEEIMEVVEENVEDVLEEMEKQGFHVKDLLVFIDKNVLNTDTLEHILMFIDETLGTVVDSTFMSHIANSLIENVAEELPSEEIEEILALVPWEDLESLLKNLEEVTVEEVKMLFEKFKPLLSHILEKLSTIEEDLIEKVTEVISEEIDDTEDENLDDVARQADEILSHLADAMTNNHLRQFANKVIKAVKPQLEKHSPSRCAEKPMKVVCYYPNWVYYRKGDGKYTVDDIDTSLCTHIIYSFVILDGEKHVIKAHDTWLDIDRSGSRGWNLGNFRKFTALKKTNPKTKYMLALGGWNDSKKSKYSELLADPVKIDNFVEHAVGFLKEYGFDGLDLDYEYPNYDGHGHDAPYSDKPGFTLLCQKLSSAFKQHNFELTAAVSASKAVIADAYEIPEISKYLDAIHMMSYDLHGSWEKIVNHHSPIYGEEWDPLTTDFGANYWISQGCPKEKLIVGIPTYGRSWTLGGWDSKAWEYELNSTAGGPGAAGPLTRAKGFLAYNEICKFVNEEGWTKVSDPTNKMGPYAYKGNQWVGYDDPAIAEVKAKYILEKQFGGAMFWDLPSDDFGNRCGGGRYPIIGAVSKILKGQSSCRKQGLQTPRKF